MRALQGVSGALLVPSALAIIVAVFPKEERGGAIGTWTAWGGIGILGVSFAFGLTVLTMIFTLGYISGCHLNPAVSIGLWVAKRFPGSDLLPYIIAQVLGAIAGSGVLYLIASGKEGFTTAAGFASNGYGARSPGGYSLLACLVTEVVLTMFFLLIILGSTDERIPKGFAAIAIGFALTLIHLISIPVTNTSVNPARSTGPALFAGGWALSQLWLFWVAPVAGAALAGFGKATARLLEQEPLLAPVVALIARKATLTSVFTLGMANAISRSRRVMAMWSWFGTAFIL